MMVALTGEHLHRGGEVQRILFHDQDAMTARAARAVRLIVGARATTMQWRAMALGLMQSEGAERSFHADRIKGWQALLNRTSLNLRLGMKEIGAPAKRGWQARGYRHGSYTIDMVYFALIGGKVIEEHHCDRG
ncbi:hypothetical protein [Cupriavidus basilensis]